MTRPQALMGAVSANLNWFLQPIGQDLTKPQKKFLRDGLIGLLPAGRSEAMEANLALMASRDMKVT